MRVHDGYMNPRNDDDFYEDDEPVADVIRAFEQAEKHLTAPPRGINETLEIPDDLRPLELLLSELPTHSAQVRG